MFQTISVKEGAAGRFTELRTQLGLDTTETLEVLMAAYDVISSTGRGQAALAQATQAKGGEG